MQDKFDNFKRFVNEQIPHSPINMMLSVMNLETFIRLLMTLRAKEQIAAGEKIHQRVLGKLGLDATAFEPAALDRFERYCEYFMQVVDQIAA